MDGDVGFQYKIQVDDTDNTFSSLVWDSNGSDSLPDCLDTDRCPYNNGISYLSHIFIFILIKVFH